MLLIFMLESLKITIAGITIVYILKKNKINKGGGKNSIKWSTNIKD